MIKREDVDKKYKWDIDCIFHSEDDFYKSIENIKNISIKLQQYQSHLNDSDLLLKCLKNHSQGLLECRKVLAYTSMKNDENVLSDDFHTMTCDALDAKNMFFKNASFIFPELILLDASYINTLVMDNRFEEYSLDLIEINRHKEHVLSSDEERMISLFSGVFDSFDEIFEAIRSSDLQFGKIKNSQGEAVDISHSTFALYMEDKDRKFRKNVFKKYYKEYKKYSNSLFITYYNFVKKNVACAKLRKFSNCMEESLFVDNIDASVYENLINSVNNNLHIVHRHVKLHGKLLGIKSPRSYDMSICPFTLDNDKKISYDDAVAMTVDGLSVLGKKYIGDMKKAFQSNWVDACEVNGKQSGAYCCSCYGYHPFILINFQENLQSVLTLSHEMGHAMHTHYSYANNCFNKSDYTIFIAEIASIVNEVLLLKHMIKNSLSYNDKKYYTYQLIHMFRNTLFRQTMISEFESYVHDKVLIGEHMGIDELNDKYFELNMKYYGYNFSYDDEMAIEWMRIPHLYRQFYVYKYATGMVVAASIVSKIENNEPEIIDKYIKFLSLGGSKYPLDCLKQVGVDMTSEAPFNDAMSQYKQLVYSIERMCV